MQIVKWNQSTEGFTSSKCGRFDIAPLYHGTTTAQEYQIRDNESGRVWTADTQKVLKAEAQDTIDKENAR